MFRGRARRFPWRGPGGVALVEVKTRSPLYCSGTLGAAIPFVQLLIKEPPTPSVSQGGWGSGLDCVVERLKKKVSAGRLSGLPGR
jgi:hypothetical protein